MPLSPMQPLVTTWRRGARGALSLSPLLVAVALLLVAMRFDTVYAAETEAADASLASALLGSLEKEHDFAFAEVRSGDEAREIFCACNFKEETHGKTLSEMCPGISAQCRKSFCKPLCLRMAWHPVIRVNCDAAPTWTWCPKFKAQVEEAHRALTAQFQAFTCLNMHFCNETDHIHDWIENHSFGNQYPKHHLPVDSCVHKDATEDQSKLLCTACERVIDADIERGECLPQFTTLQPGSLQERCLYLADVIGNRKEDLLRDFRQQVCSCLGCCGDGRCIFRNPEEGWLENLIDTVTNRVTAQLEIEGWATLRNRSAESRTTTETQGEAEGEGEAEQNTESSNDNDAAEAANADTPPVSKPPV